MMMQLDCSFILAPFCMFRCVSPLNSYLFQSASSGIFARYLSRVCDWRRSRLLLCECAMIIPYFPAENGFILLDICFAFHLLFHFYDRFLVCPFLHGICVILIVHHFYFYSFYPLCFTLNSLYISRRNPFTCHVAWGILQRQLSRKDD